jgi:hypothetical protein
MCIQKYGPAVWLSVRMTLLIAGAWQVAIAQTPSHTPTLQHPAAPTTAQQPAPGGNTIKTLIQDAIGVAFPQVGTLLGKIFGTNSTPSTTTTKAQAEQPLTDARTTALAQAQAKLAPINAIADELQTVNTFVVPAQRVQVQLATIRSELGHVPVNWSKITGPWNAGRSYFEQMAGVPLATLDKVKTIDTRLKLANIQQAANETRSLMETAINQRNAGDTLDNLTSLDTVLRDIATLSTIESAHLRDGLADLGQWASGAAGTPSPTWLAAQERELRDSLVARYAKRTSK